MTIAEKITRIAEDMPKIYEAGKKSEYDRFWDNFQFEGTRTLYNRAFYTWRASIFKPKYDLKPTRADYMFMDMFPEYASSGGYSLVKALSDANAILDTSQCTNFTYMFYYSYINEVGEIDTRSATSLDAIFNYARFVKKVEKLILKNDGSQSFSAAFEVASSLKHITIDGTIGKSIDFKQCPLSKASILNITEHLSDIAEDQTITFKRSAVNTAFESSLNVSDGENSQEFTTLVASKPNWKFILN